MPDQPTSSPDIFDVSFEDYDEKVIAASHRSPILVDLWADWCMPCLVIAPKLKSLVEEYHGRLRLALTPAERFLLDPRSARTASNSRLARG